MNNILVTICARGGSKGLINKNIKKINGYPLIYYSIKIAKEFLQLNKGYLSLSTDDKKIKNISKKYNLYTEYDRPIKLALDSTGKIETIRHLLKYEENRLKTKFDYILDLDVSSPLRTLIDLNLAYKKIQTQDNSLNLFSVSKCKKNPYFNMVKKKQDFYDRVLNYKTINSRQNAPKVYEMNASFYFYKRSFFSTNFKSVFSKKSLIYLMPHICFDIDDKIDYEFMKYLIENNKLDFKI